jgi:hypothetical protein
MKGGDFDEAEEEVQVESMWSDSKSFRFLMHSEAILQRGVHELAIMTSS